MDEFLRLTLPIYFIIYFGLAFVLKSVIVSRQIGKNSLVGSTANSLENYKFA